MIYTYPFKAIICIGLLMLFCLVIAFIRNLLMLYGGDEDE